MLFELDKENKFKARILNNATIKHQTDLSKFFFSILIDMVQLAATFPLSEK